MLQDYLIFDPVVCPPARLMIKMSKKGILFRGGGGGGGYFRNFWVGMCRWDSGTLNLYQS